MPTLLIPAQLSMLPTFFYCYKRFHHLFSLPICDLIY